MRLTLLLLTSTALLIAAYCVRLYYLRVSAQYAEPVKSNDEIEALKKRIAAANFCGKALWLLWPVPLAFSGLVDLGGLRSVSPALVVGLWGGFFAACVFVVKKILLQPGLTAWNCAALSLSGCCLALLLAAFLPQYSSLLEEMKRRLEARK